MRRKILVADLLCGAGGSSTGCSRALADLGLEMELVCLNHWPVAIATHQRNHPEARHYCQDIATVRPHIIVPEGYLDLLMASPTCTHHSVARGGKPTSDQQRSDPWHIITWLTELRVKRMIIENVWEFVGWGPVDMRTGRPIKSRKGEYFHAWIETIRRLGFEPEWRKLNAADYGDATTRQRFILMARSDGRKVAWPTPTHRKRNDSVVDLFGDIKPWRPAREIIDWSIKGKSIFNRKKPLAPKTLARIHAGAVKFAWPEPFLVILRNHMAGQSIGQPIPTIAANGMHIGLAEPVIMNGRKGNQAQSVSTTPLPTLDTKGGVWLAEPLILSQHNSGAPRSTDQPLPTITTGGAGAEKRQGCARPIIVTVAHGNEQGDRTAESRRSHSILEPLGAIHGTGISHAVVEPFMLSRQGEGAPRSTDEPTPTQTAKHSHVLISPYYGSGSGETCQTASEPLPTVTSKARFGVVVPVTQSNGGAGARSTDEPIPTMTTAKGGEFALVLPVTHAGGPDRVQNPNAEPLPTVTGANRGELAFILAEATESYDILFRMLEPHELSAAMGFDSEEAAYEFAGTKTEKIKQIGNAVSVSKMKACVSAIMADADPSVSQKPSRALQPAKDAA